MTLNDGQLGNSAASIYTPPNGSNASLSSVVFGNNDTSARQVTVEFSRTADRKLFSFSIPAKGSAVLTGDTGLRRGDNLKAFSDVASVVDFVVQGTETNE